MSNTKTYNLPILSNEGGLGAYLAQIKKFPMLDAEEEYMLAKNWKNTGNVKSAEKLVTSHLRLVAKIAMGYKGYGLPLNEIISEGNVGLMQAVKKFEPEKGFRLATYAMWWIKASIQEYILRSWSLVKIGTTTAQKKLFFNLKKLKNQIAPQTEGDLKNEHVTEIANKLDVSKDEVVSMNRRLSGKEFSLNAQVGEDGDEWQYWLVDKDLDQDLFAWKAVQIAKIYDNALLAVEVNSLQSKGLGAEGNHYLTILDEISEHYDNLFMRTSLDQIREGQPKRYGFHTNKASKTMMIDNYNFDFIVIRQINRIKCRCSTIKSKK